ncbi:MAG: ribosome silencing factor [Beijerinckiaceae bacterium]|nr:ribosome silencing factor [Beijerinckiaceae bacterium]
MNRTAAAPSQAGPGPVAPPAGSLVEALRIVLDDAKAEDIVSLDLEGKTSLADAMIIASGRSDRHVGAIADRVAFALKERGLPPPRIEGMPVCDWVLIDAGDIIVHLFRPEVRGFYNLEKLWGLGRPQEGAAEAPAEKPKRRVVRTRNAAE